MIARQSGNRANESHLAVTLSRVEALHGDPLAALDYFTLTIRNYHDSRDTTNVRSPLAVLTALFDRIGRYQPAAIIGGFAINLLVTAAAPSSASRLLTFAMCSTRRPTNRSPARARR